MSISILEEKRNAAYDNIKKNGWKYLQYLEQNSLHKPRDIVIIGKKLLSLNYVSSSNRWRLLERIAISSLELGDKQTSKDCIKELTSKFKNSNRVRILRGMFYETKDEIKKSNDEYVKILENDINNMMAKKRRVALCIEQKQTVGAIKLLCEYLKLYGNDVDAWKQLMILYSDNHCYDLAKFCCEELITMNHNDYNLFLIYAEMLYNIGGNVNYTNSLKYFSQSLLLSSDKNTRALWGIIMCIRSLKKIDALSSNDKEIIQNARNKIIKNYTDSKSGLVNIVKDVLISFTTKND